MIAEEEVLRRISELVRNILGDEAEQDIELDRDVSLVFDFGFESLEFVALLQEVQRQFEIPAQELSSRFANGWSVSEVTVGQIVDLIRSESELRVARARER